ncbi:DUF1957 domain-containing protein [Chloroflexia bacterium SDU3-3]|nr:DUF1957 domain-containing protein [Chloroflexia bacterium SDU3-3]
MNTGSAALILTAHAPYLRSAGREPVGEDRLHELTASALIPALNTLYDLCERDLRPRLGLALSPLLLEQLGDPVVQKHFYFWIERRIAQAQDALASAAGDQGRAYLAQFYIDWAEGIRTSFDVRFGRNLVAALRPLVDAQIVEPLASAASYPRLASIGRATTLRAQIDLGVMAAAQAYGCRPRGFWPPSGAYRAAAGPMLADNEVAYVLLDPADVQDRSTAPGWVVQRSLMGIPVDRAFDAYVSAPDLDYSGDPLYRAPVADADGFAWHRNGMGGQPELYDPYDAYQRAQEHAAHFLEVMAARGRESQRELSVIVLDAAVVGGRWFEGASWFRALLTELAEREDQALTTPGAYMDAVLIRRTLALRPEPLAEGGVYGGQHLFSLQQSLRAAEARLGALAKRHPTAAAERERVLQQAARELLLAQSHDLAAREEAHSAPRQMMRHLTRCIQLCDLAERPELSEDDLVLLETLEEEDNPFAHVNYRIFADL